MSRTNTLSQQIIKNSSDPDLIKRVFEFANKGHKGQKRISGECYILHPLRVALTLEEMKLDPKTVSAALLHDIVDDTDFSLEDVEKEFGKEITFLVNGVSKLGKLRYPKTELEIPSIKERAKWPVDLRAENLRKMFFAMAEDIRVVLIKLADRLDNMRTLNYLPKPKQQRIALETLEIFAPLANRLGMAEIKGKLEDLAFPYLYPKEYKWLQEQVKEKYEERKKYLNKVKPVLIKILAEEGIKPITIDFRAKYQWSLYQKLLRHDMDLEKIYDLVALRVIFKDIETCYRALGIMHKSWKPLHGRIKDYISLPKPTGYQSLHTTCFCLEGKITEIQIRTPEMHEEAEHGIASHWAKKEGLDFKTQRRKFAWVSQLRDWQKGISNSKEFLEGLKIDFFKDRIFVFTPKGDVIDLPDGATPVDFAYAVHTDIGNRCAGAKINGKMTSLSQSLKNGDLVEIITAKNKMPSRDWLEFVKTSMARSRVREWLKKESRPANFSRGMELLNRELKQIQGTSLDNVSKSKKEKLLKVFPYKDIRSLVIAVGEGEIRPREILKILLKEEEILFSRTKKPKAQVKLDKKLAGVALAGKTGILINLGKCCLPKINDKIQAYITLNQGATVHRSDCDNLKRAKKKWPRKVIEASWLKEKEAPYQINLEITAKDRVGLLKDVSFTISTMKVNILEFHAEFLPSGKSVLIAIEVEISGLEELKKLFSQIKEIKGVLEVKKIS